MNSRLGRYDSGRAERREAEASRRGPGKAKKRGGTGKHNKPKAGRARPARGEGPESPPVRGLRVTYRGNQWTGLGSIDRAAALLVQPPKRVLADHDECVLPEHLRAKAVHPGLPRRATVAAAEGAELKRTCRDEVAELKRRRTAGAIIAPSRTNEEYPLATGNWRTCLVDAVVNGARQLGVWVSQQKLRSLAIPKLGNVLEASWGSAQNALERLETPLALVEVSRHFYAGEPPMLALLGAPRGVYIVRMEVVIDGTKNMHCVMLSTVPEPGKPHGKLVSNHGRPVYIEPRDTRSKKTAKKAFEKLLAQNGVFAAAPARRFDVTDVYELTQKRK